MPRRQFDESTWDAARCVVEFNAHVNARDHDGLVATMKALDRLGCWRAAIGKLADHDQDVALGADLLNLWNVHGFHIAESLKGDHVLLDALKRHVPVYLGPGMTLYRGELEQRYRQQCIGMAWTPQIETAEMFANRRLQIEGSPGVILAIDATAEIIVAAPSEHSTYLNEAEYLVDTRLIQDVRTMASVSVG